MNQNSSKIKTAFILSIIGNSVWELILIAYLYLAARLSSISVNLSAMGTLYLIIFATLIFAPFVLGIVSMQLIKNISPSTPQDRVFRILTKIFSIVNIIGGAIVIGYVLIAVFIIGLLVSIFAGQEALITLLLAL